MIAGLVSHYRVVSTLGAGGMGVVYKAIDTRLNRAVAIKALNEKHGLDTSATLRLRREALAAASLDHPYICKVYELLETDEGTLIVMEFVEGETLAAMLERGVPPIADTLRYGAEIAEGLANAHARGLVHRDIKPSNVMVTLHGHVKLLDFGIVRIDNPGSGVTATHHPLTLPGAAAGSPFYMSPEQALGQPVDARSDLFSLGTVLFQCLTGELPFEGTTRDAYMQAMLAGRVRPLEQLAPTIPAAAGQLVRQCLERNTARRLDSAATLATRMRQCAETMSGYVTAAGWQRQSRQRLLFQILAILFVIAVVAIGFRMWFLSRPLPEIPFRTMIPAVTWASAESDPRFSPDGRWLSFLSDRDGAVKLFVQQLEGGKAVPLDLSGAAVVGHAWSPDGKEIACVVRQQQHMFLQIVPAFFGGLPRVSVPLTPVPEAVRVVRWIGADILLDVNRGFAGRPLWQVSPETGSIRDLKSTWPTDLAARQVDVSADGRDAIVAARKDGQDDLWLIRLDGTSLRRLTNDAFVERDPVWIGSTPVVAYQSARSGQLDLWQIDTRSGRSTQVTSSPTVEVPAGSTPDGSVLAYVQSANTAALWTLDGAAGTSRQLTTDALSDFWPSLSVDGQRMAFQRARPTVREGFEYFDSRIVVTDPSAVTQAAEPETVADGFGARLSPDGSWVAYLQRSSEPTRLILQARNLKTGESRTIWDRCPLVALTNQAPVDWVDQHFAWKPGSVELLFIGAREAGSFIGRANLAAAARIDVVAEAPSDLSLRDIRPSPDGRSLAYLAAKNTMFEVRVRDLQSGRDSLVTTVPGQDYSLMLRGWSSPTSLVLLNAQPKLPSDVEVNEATLPGATRRIAAIHDAFAATARLDAERKRLLVTRTEGGVHNIFAVSLADGRLTVVTDNRLPAVSFAGIEPSPSRGIVYARPEWKRDIWLARSPM